MTPGRLFSTTRRPRAQRAREVAVGRVLEVERDRLLAAVDRSEVLAVAAVHRRPLAHRVALGRLDLDDLGAEVGEQHAAERAGGDLAELDDLEARERGAEANCHGGIGVAFAARQDDAGYTVPPGGDLLYPWRREAPHPDGPRPHRPPGCRRRWSRSWRSPTGPTRWSSSLPDKFNHVAAFAVLALLADYSFPTAGFGAAKVLALAGYGLSIEVVQHFLPYREASFSTSLPTWRGSRAYALCIPLLARIPVLRRPNGKPHRPSRQRSATVMSSSDLVPPPPRAGPGCPPSARGSTTRSSSASASSSWARWAASPRPT